MTEIKGELWDHYGASGYTILITTNGTVTKQQKCVMGRGCALEARGRFPGIDLELGKKIRAHGNIVQPLRGGSIYSFPVKHHWSDDADPRLILTSACELALIAYENSHQRFILPRPGCGNGHLSWENEVRGLIGDFLPDNVVVITK